MANPIFTYTVSVCGGIGDRIWDNEFKVQAQNVTEAAKLAQERVDKDEFNVDGWVTGVSQDD